MSRTFVTGFGPFRDVQENPSALLAAKAGLPFQVLEVSYEAADQFVANFDAFGYENLLMMGVAAGRPHVSVELTARNLRSGLDVLGVSSDGMIEVDGPPEIASTLWTQEMMEFLKVDFPGALDLSWDAGSYLCNYIYYRALRKLSTRRIGFLHVAGFDHVPFETQEKIVKAVVEELTGS